MTKKIILFTLFPCCVIALLLALNGVHTVELDNSYYNFINTVNIRLSGWEVAIPNIPEIPLINNVGGVWVVINAIVSFFNGLIGVINILTSVINVLIHLLQFILTLVYSCKDFINGFVMVP